MKYWKQPEIREGDVVTFTSKTFKVVARVSSHALDIQNDQGQILTVERSEVALVHKLYDHDSAV